jgi:hypothetical protein
MAWYIWLAVILLAVVYYAITSEQKSQQYPYLNAQRSADEPLSDHPDIKLLSRKVLGTSHSCYAAQCHH